jgi:hypothetical protein
MRHLLAVLSRARGALIYTAVCVGLLLLARERAWQHVSTLNGDEWLPIQSYVRANRRGEEPICFLPSWTTGHATDLYKFRGIDLLEQPEDAWEDGRAEPGFWVVSQFDVFDPASVPRNLYPYRAHITMGGAEIYVFRREAFPAFSDSLALRLREAKCRLHGPLRDGVTTIDLIWSRTGYIVPRDLPNREAFGYLACRTEQARAGGRDHFGIWFHPPPAGYTLEVVWPRIELQPWVAVEGGLKDAIAARRGPDTELAVKVDGVVVDTLRFPSKRGWETFAVPVPAKTGQAAGSKRIGSLGFEVSTKNNNSRHFVFDARLEQVRPEETVTPGPAQGPTVTPGLTTPDAAIEGDMELGGEGEGGSLGIDEGLGPRIKSAPGPRPRSTR